MLYTAAHSDRVCAVMRSIFSIVFSVLISCVCAFAQARKLDESAAQFVRERLCPLPQKAEFFDAYYTMSKDSSVLLRCSAELSDGDRRTLADEMQMLFKFLPKMVFKTDASCAPIPEEGYTLRIDGGGIDIGASGVAGLVHSLKTLRQMSELDRLDVFKRVFAHCDIEDAPEIKTRMIHLCLFPDLTADRFEKYLRLAWYYKFNYVIIEGWGTFPLEKHPEFSFEKRVSKSDFKRWIDFCKKYKMTPVPQMQVWGHASQAQEFSAKHVVENRHPELANLYEPLGWTYCYSNPKTMLYLKDNIAELAELFGNPPFFHLGCDEAYDRATCHKCRAEKPSALFARVINAYSDFLKERGMRGIIWHDTLIDAKNPAWKKQIVHGDAESEASLDEISKNIIIADWQYAPQTDFPTSRFFKSKGFDVLGAPWNAKTGVYAFARAVKKDALWGYLQTTWNAQFKKIDVVFYHAANAAWRGGDESVEKQLSTQESGSGHAHHRRLMLSADKHFKEVESDMGKDFDFRELGKYYNHLEVR